MYIFLSMCHTCLALFLKEHGNLTEFDGDKEILLAIFSSRSDLCFEAS